MGNPTADQIRKQQTPTNLQTIPKKFDSTPAAPILTRPPLPSWRSRLGAVSHAGPASLRLLPSSASALPCLPAQAAKTAVAPRQAPDQKAAAVQRVAAPAPCCCTTAKERKQTSAPPFAREDALLVLSHLLRVKERKEIWCWQCMTCKRKV